MQNVKKIAYAPSIADPWKESSHNASRAYLKNLDFISVREESDIAIVQQLSEKKVEHVLDPVFLNTKEFWSNRTEKPKIKGEYILCYFLSVTSLAVETVRKIKELTGLPIVYINLNTLDKFNSDFDIRTANPLEFIGYIENATYVCTNSFYCSAFSVIFNKNYCVVPKSLSNERMISLQSMFKIGNRIIDKNLLQNLTVADLKTDYSEYENIKDQLVEKSRFFLKESIFKGEK